MECKVRWLQEMGDWGEGLCSQSSDEVHATPILARGDGIRHVPCDCQQITDKKHLKE